MTYSCAVALSSGIVELRVVHCPGISAWSILSTEAKTLDWGVAISREAAQLASQLAFEKRLGLAGMKQQTPERYKWVRAFERE